MRSELLKITAPFQLTLPEIPLGSGNSNALWPLVQTLNAYVPEKGRSRVGDTVVWEGHLDVEIITWAIVTGVILANGGEVDYYPAFFEVTDPTKATPSLLPDSELFDEDGSSLGQKTWEEWVATRTAQPLIINGRWFCKSTAATGAFPPASLLKAAYDADANIKAILSIADLPEESA